MTTLYAKLYSFVSKCRFRIAGRYFALTVFSPILFLCGYRVYNKDRLVGCTLMYFSAILFLWEGFWVSRTTSEVVYM